MEMIRKKLTWEDRELVLESILTFQRRVLESCGLPSNQDARESVLSVHPELNYLHYVDELYTTKDADAVMQKIQNEIERFYLTDKETAIVKPQKTCEVL